MRQYYASDKKRREDAKRKQREEKRLKRLNKRDSDAKPDEPGAQPALNGTILESGPDAQEQKP